MGASQVQPAARCPSCGRRVGPRRRAEHSMKMIINTDPRTEEVRRGLLKELHLDSNPGNLQAALDEFVDFDNPQDTADWAARYEGWGWYGRHAEPAEKSALFLQKSESLTHADFTMFSHHDLALRHFRELR